MRYEFDFSSSHRTWCIDRFVIFTRIEIRRFAVGVNIEVGAFINAMKLVSFHFKSIFSEYFVWCRLFHDT